MGSENKGLSPWRKIMLTILGMLGVGLAMALMHFSDVGADPITVLIGGIAQALQLSEGVATTLLNAVFFVFLLFFNRGAIRGATLISVLVMGPFIDLSLLALHMLFPVSLSYLVCLGLMLFGSVLLGFSIGFYLSLEFGSSPADGVMLWLHTTLHIRYRYCTWTLYTVCLIIGWLLGGRVAEGTFIALVVVGIVCDFTLNRFQRIWSSHSKLKHA